jgi:hypothetical protein
MYGSGNTSSVFLGFTMARIQLILLSLLAVSMSVRARSTGPRLIEISNGDFIQDENGEV